MSHIPTTKQLQRVTGQIMALLSVNGENTRPVFDMSDKELPSGQNILLQLVQQYRFDAVRCEIGSITLTVEVTTQRKGEQEEQDENHLRFCTSSYELFRMWLFRKLREAGIEPKYPGSGVPTPTDQNRPVTPKPDLGRKPFGHSKFNRRRQ